MKSRAQHNDTKVLIVDHFRDLANRVKLCSSVMNCTKLEEGLVAEPTAEKKIRPNFWIIAVMTVFFLYYFLSGINSL